MPGLSADSLEDVTWETKATPGLQQLAWVLTIQLQVLNGTDDLSMHISNHTKHTHPVWRRKKRGGTGEQEKGREHRNTKEGRKGKKKTKHKAGCDSTPSLPPP